MITDSSELERLTVALAGRYAIKRELGRGGMATVYLARDLKHEREVALKVLRPELSAVIGAERFLAEIRTTANLQHMNILPLFDSGIVDGVAFYVMPFVDGESLRDRLGREKQLPVGDAVRIATEVASALDYAHRHGVVHRDVKPENVLLHDGHAVVADFGIALAVSAGGGARMTETGMSLGTPHYMAPEQAMGEREITSRADVYALGATLYEMLVGEPPFTGASAQAIVAKVLTSAAPSITGQRHTVPAHVEAAVMTALEKLPADRFATASEFAAALRGDGAATSVRPAARAPRASRARLVLVGTGALALGGLAGFVAHRPAEPAAFIFDQVSFGRQTIFGARVAPDGKTIVYSGATEGVDPSLYVIRPESPRPQPLGQPHSVVLSISSQGELAVLVRAQNLRARFFVGTLARLPLGGGAPRELQERVYDAEWAPDGKTLLVVRPVGDSVVVEFPSGTRRYATTGFISSPRFSADVRRVAFLEHKSSSDDRGVAKVLDLESGRAVTVSPEYPSVAGVSWSLDGREVRFGAFEGSGMIVLAADLQGHVRPTLGGAGDIVALDRRADGALLVAREEMVKRIFERMPGAPADSDVSWLDNSALPVLSRDGSMLVFSDQGTGSSAKYTLRARFADGRFAEIGEGNPRAISPDGQWVMSNTPGQAGKAFTLYPLGAGTARTIRSPGLEAFEEYAFYPDGASVLARAKVPGGVRCFRVPLDGAPPVPVSTVGPGGSVALSPDGRRVYCGRRVYDSPTDTGRAIPALEALRAQRLNAVSWSADGRALFARVGSFVVHRIGVDDGTDVVMLDLTPPRGSTVTDLVGLSFAADPRQYAYSRREYRSTLYWAKGAR